MPKETFDALTKTQKAGLVSFAYNCGSFYYYPDIIDNIKADKFEEAAVGIENGPSKGAEDGKVYTGLIRRRREEAALFRYK
jgi:GH24 family phage-related lysozyme (muramidase)